MAEVEVWTQGDIATLKAAIVAGILSVSYSGPPARTVTYQSLPEMRALLANIVQAVNGGPTHRLVQMSRGFRRGW